MRALFTAVVVLGICSCAKYSQVDSPKHTAVPFLNLREPVYIVADQSLWSGCEDDPTGDEACHVLRVEQINKGVSQWFDYFDKATRPLAVVVNSETDVPLDRVNPIITMYIRPGSCPYKNSIKLHAACFKKIDNLSSEIVFNSAGYIYPSLVAHEFGHALGRVHNDFAKDVHSIMFPFVKLEAHVLSADIDLLCGIHAECPAR